MKVNNLILAANPFSDAYFLSDFFGKAIFLGLIFLSIWSWVLLLQKAWLTYQTKKEAEVLRNIFDESRQSPLNVDFEKHRDLNKSHPFFEMYKLAKRQSLELLNKNNKNVKDLENQPYLSSVDIDSVGAQLNVVVSRQLQRLEKNLYLLSMIVSLAPFIGLLGTVWGILITFGQLQASGGGGTHQVVLGGLSLALVTTVMGLLDAIPALVGYSYLKNSLRSFAIEMEGFATELLTSLEITYRKSDI